MAADNRTTADKFAGFSRQELNRRAESFRHAARVADTIAERNRLETLAREYDAACDRAWRGNSNAF